MPDARSCAACAPRATDLFALTLAIVVLASEPAYAHDGDAPTTAQIRCQLLAAAVVGTALWLICRHASHALSQLSRRVRFSASRRPDRGRAPRNDQ
jgi:hypothetical protein